MTDSTDNARGPERIVWDAMVWAAQQPAPRYGAAYPSYTDRGNSDAEIKCRETVARIRADLAPDPLADPRVMALVEALRGIEALAATNYTPARIARTALAALSPTGGNDE